MCPLDEWIPSHIPTCVLFGDGTCHTTKRLEVCPWDANEWRRMVLKIKKWRAPAESHQPILAMMATSLKCSPLKWLSFGGCMEEALTDFMINRVHVYTHADHARFQIAKKRKIKEIQAQGNAAQNYWKQEYDAGRVHMASLEPWPHSANLLLRCICLWSRPHCIIVWSKLVGAIVLSAPSVSWGDIPHRGDREVQPTLARCLKRERMRYYHPIYLEEKAYHAYCQERYLPLKIRSTCTTKYLSIAAKAKPITLAGYSKHALSRIVYVWPQIWKVIVNK